MERAFAETSINKQDSQIYLSYPVCFDRRCAGGPSRTGGRVDRAFAILESLLLLILPGAQGRWAGLLCVKNKNCVDYANFTLSTFLLCDTFQRVFGARAVTIRRCCATGG